MLKMGVFWQKCGFYSRWHCNQEWRSIGADTVILALCTFFQISYVMYILNIKTESKKGPTFKNWPIVKNPQFLSNPHETW